MIDRRVLASTTALTAIRSGDAKAHEELLAQIYDELKQIARGVLHKERRDHTLQPTALVHEAYLRLVDQSRLQWQDRAHFFAIAARLMRQILIDHARRRNAQKRGGGWVRLTVERAVAFSKESSLDLIDLDEALNRLARLDERKSRVVELRFFGGLNVEEVAEVLKVSKRTVEEDWFLARAWLRNELSKG